MRTSLVLDNLGVVEREVVESRNLNGLCDSLKGIYSGSLPRDTSERTREIVTNMFSRGARDMLSDCYPIRKGYSSANRLFEAFLGIAIQITPLKNGLDKTELLELERSRIGFLERYI